MSKKLAKQEAAARNAADSANELSEVQLWAGWLKKTRRSKKKAAKVGLKDDERYFVVLVADGTVYITWTKTDDPAKILAGDHFHAVADMTCECIAWRRAWHHQSNIERTLVSNISML